MSNPSEPTPEPGAPAAVPPPAATPVEAAVSKETGPGTFSSPGTGEAPGPIPVTIEPALPPAAEPGGRYQRCGNRAVDRLELLDRKSLDLTW